MVCRLGGDEVGDEMERFEGMSILSRASRSSACFFSRSSFCRRRRSRCMRGRPAPISSCVSTAAGAGGG